MTGHFVTVTIGTKFTGLNDTPADEAFGYFMIALAVIVVAFALVFGVLMLGVRSWERFAPQWSTWWTARREARAARKRPAAPDPSTLTYCQGCGCNHRFEYMSWEDGIFMCRICCRGRLGKYNTKKHV